MRKNSSLSVGVDTNFAPNLVQTLTDYRTGGFDFCCLPLCHPRNRRQLVPYPKANSSTTPGDEGASSPATAPQSAGPQNLTEDEAWTRSDMLLDSSQWTTVVVGKMSSWLDFESEDYFIRLNSEKVFWQEAQWAIHLTLPALLLPTPTITPHHYIPPPVTSIPPAVSTVTPPVSPSLPPTPAPTSAATAVVPPTVCAANYAHLIYDLLQRASFMALWLRIPLVSPTDSAKTDDDDTDEYESEDTWEWWNHIRTRCDHHTNLSVVLEVTGDLPSEEHLSRWCGEPVKALIIPTSVFMRNAKGFPVLDQRHQRFLMSMFDHDVQVILTGQPHHASGLVPYKAFLQTLYSRLPAVPYQDQAELSYLDYLQAPLQPLADNLESQTYETFEKDPIKYKRYEEAVHAAVMDMKVSDNTEIVVMVLGAGRGPLVKAVLSVAKSTGRNFKVFAVEKNPNAIVTLKNMKITQHWDNVTIVSADMRYWEAPVKADIIVSELLGSFGDNELSPECLDGAQKFLKPDGISIPYSYTSYLAPLTSEKLYNEVKAHNDVAHFETPYVVKLHSVHLLGKPQPCFTFVHPNRDILLGNDRFTTLQFHMNTNATVHGFSGYFQAMLYKNINISINPETYSIGMFSWFPIFFPIRAPILVHEGETLVITMKRASGKSRVWYEWDIVAPTSCQIHNPNGRSYFMSL
ncbi:protein arginine N-methyltransferase 1.5 [Pelomyxa schiedti]|nr:protein arginine N-methyltransferase 1.5 [Pelomyxa schiedti]